jgi:hypothetical protein
MRKVFRILVPVILLSTPFQSYSQDIEQMAKQKPVTVTGYLDVKSIFYHASGIPPRRKDFSYFINGAPTITLYGGLVLPFSFTISDQDRSFRQPFNQFGVSPSYKWATAHLGYRNLNFSPYTLAGYTMLGAGAELNPGIFKFGFMYGRLNRATTLDTTTGVVQPYSFSRKGYAAHIGVGKEDNNVDISFLKAQDDSGSLNSKIHPGDTVSVMPAANAVVSIVTHQKIAQKLSFDADLGYSVYTRNIGSHLADSGDVKNIPGVFHSFVPVNATSEDYLAYSATLAYKEKYFSIKLGYKRIDPGFQSMGAYFFNNDLQNITISPGFVTKNSKFRFNGSIGFQRDNLKKQKEATTRRVIGSANLSWNITTELGIDANYMNFSSNATPEVVSVDNKYMLAHTTQNISINPRYILNRNDKLHVVMLAYNYSTLIDANVDSKSVNTMKTNVAFLTYSLTWIKKGLTVTPGANITNNYLVTGNTSYYGVSLGANKLFLKDNSLQVGTQNSYSINQDKNGANVLNLGLNSSYRTGARHRFSVRWYMLKTNFKDHTVNKNFTENTGEVGYTFTL